MVQHVSFTLVPSPVPKDLFDQALSVQKDFGMLMHLVSRDHAFLKESYQRYSTHQSFWVCCMIHSHLFPHIRWDEEIEVSQCHFLPHDHIYSSHCSISLVIQASHINCLKEYWLLNYGDLGVLWWLFLRVKWLLSHLNRS